MPKKSVEKHNDCGRTFATEAELEKAVSAYFAKSEERADVVSEAGLALHLGVTVNTLRSWHDGKSCLDLRLAVQNAYARMTGEYMQLLLSGNKGIVPFVIFMLKQPRFAGYQDKVESKTDIAVNVKMGAGMDASDFQ